MRGDPGVQAGEEARSFPMKVRHGPGESMDFESEAAENKGVENFERGAEMANYPAHTALARQYAASAAPAASFLPPNRK
jgi:hypothetical protein